MKSSISTLLVAAAVMLFSASQAQAQLNILWGAGSGDPAEETEAQFDGGLNSWTAVSLFDGNNTTGGNALWTHTTTGHSQGGYYDSTAAVVPGLLSPSAANGAALFDSDFLDNAGTAGAFGTGVAPSPHAGALISPSIDLTGNPDVLVQFHSYFRRFTPTEVFVGVSTDGGATWSDFSAVDPLPGVNSWTGNNALQYVDISSGLAGAASLANVQIRFLFDGDYYFWMVDDVALVEKPNYNLTLAGPEAGNTLGDAFTTTRASSYYSTPLGQVDSRFYGFGAKIRNNGSLTETGATVIFNVDYTDNQGNTVTSDFRDSVVFNLAPGADTIITIPGTYEPSVAGTYTATYELMSSGTEITEFLTDNVEEQEFIINEYAGNENYYSYVPRAADGGPAVSRSILAGVATGNTLTDFEYGSMFRIRNREISGSVRTLDSVYYRPVNFNADNLPPMDGEVVTVILYEWVDVDGDGGIPEDHSSAIGTELIITGVANDTLPAGIADGDLRQLTLTDAVNIPAAPQIELKDTSTYVLTVRNTNANGVFVGIRAYDLFNYSLNVSTTGADGIDYWPSPTRSRATDAQGNPTNPNFPQGSWNNVGYGADIVPSIMMKLNDVVTSTQATSTPALTNVKLFPNPTSNVVNVEYAGEAEEVTYRVVDINGRVLSTEIRNNVADDVYTYDVSALPAGMYLMNISSEEGTRTLSFIVSQ